MSGSLFISERDQAFAVFDADNPEVYRLFAGLALKMLKAGGKVGARAIGERIRWDYQLVPKGHAVPRFNDLLWPRYARKLADDDARFAGFFETRTPTNRRNPPQPDLPQPV